MIVGTGVIADFPTAEGNLYPRETLEKLVNDPDVQGRIARGELVGGILNLEKLDAANGIVTHRVRCLKLFKGEVVVDIEIAENPEARRLVESLARPQAALVVKAPERIESGMKVVYLQQITAIHLREEKVASF